MSEQEKKGYVVVNGEHYEIPTKLTIGEQADVEEILGQGYDADRGGPKLDLAMVFVTLRRADPALTLEEVRRLDADSVSFKDGDDAVPPASAPDEPAVATTPAPSGAPSSDTSSASAPGS
jgi:hypothetical protein